MNSSSVRNFVLLIFVLLLAVTKAPAAEQSRFRCPRRHGAVGDGTTLDTWRDQRGD